MEPDFSVLGNAAAVPIVIAVTQFLKKSFNFKRSADVIALLVSLTVCWGWEFYHTPEGELVILWGTTLVAKLKHTIELMVVSFATWLSASKSYDLFVGDRKWDSRLEEVKQEKHELEKEVETLRGTNEPTDPEPVEEVPGLDDRLRDILEGKD